MIRLPRAYWEEIVRHCRATAPNEACGILAGAGGVVTAVYCLENSKHSPYEYEFATEGYLLLADLEDKGQLLATFHSHPRGRAYPSLTDCRLAFWPLPYVIVSLAAEPPEVRAFFLRKTRWDADEVADVIEENVEIC